MQLITTFDEIEPLLKLPFESNQLQVSPHDTLDLIHHYLIVIRGKFKG